MFQGRRTIGGSHDDMFHVHARGTDRTSARSHGRPCIGGTPMIDSRKMVRDLELTFLVFAFPIVLVLLSIRLGMIEENQPYPMKDSAFCKEAARLSMYANKDVEWLCRIKG